MTPPYIVRFMGRQRKIKMDLEIYYLILLREKFLNYLVWEKRMSSVFIC